MPSATLPSQKHLFQIPEHTVYLNSAYMGPLPRPTLEAGLQALQDRALPLSLTPQDFFAPAERVRQLCAALVLADPEQVALIPNVAAGMAVIARALQPKAGSNVVVLGDQFPSNVYPWRRWRAQGVSLRAVLAPMPAMPDPALLRERAQRWNQAVLEAIDHDTALVALEQAHWTDGTLFDLEAIAQRCRQVGAAWVIDGTQTVGAMPLDVTALQPDAVVVHSYKAMLCNYGLGFAVYGERFADAQPNEESWLMREGSEDFARLVDYRDAYAAGARRFDTSLRANPMLIRMLESSAQLLLDWQPARIRATLLEMARPAVERLCAAGFGVADEAYRAANCFGIALPPHLQAAQVRAALAEQHIHVSVRGTSVRVSPHMHNEAQDLERLADALLAL
jgi:selenocysteine lyase/cysteine desulfurase